MSAQEKNSVFFKMSINKKGVSTIVSTVLILLITVSAIAIISTILIPYVKKSLSSTDCFKTMGELKIVREKSCFNLTSAETKVTIQRENINITSIYVSASGISDSETIVKFDSDIPKSGGGQKLYVYNFPANKVSVGAVVNSKNCDISDSAELEECS